jgi:uncharacterized OB-fold protein
VESPPELPVPAPSTFSVPFWEGTKRKELLLQYDPEARKYQFFPRPISIYSGKRNLEWRAAAGTGTVFAFTIVHHAPSPAFASRTPYVVASITLDEGVRIMGQLTKIQPEQVRAGMRVRVEWEPRGGYNVPIFAPLEQRPNNV